MISICDNVTGTTDTTVGCYLHLQQKEKLNINYVSVCQEQGKHKKDMCKLYPTNL